MFSIMFMFQHLCLSIFMNFPPKFRALFIQSHHQNYAQNKSLTSPPPEPPRRTKGDALSTGGETGWRSTGSPLVEGIPPSKIDCDLTVLTTTWIYIYICSICSWYGGFLWIYAKLVYFTQLLGFWWFMVVISGELEVVRILITGHHFVTVWAK